MNEGTHNHSDAISRILSLFEEHAQIDALVFLGSRAGHIEARALDKRGRSLNIDARHAVGPRAWSILSSLSRMGLSATIERPHAEAQAMALFGTDEAARYQRALLEGEAAPSHAAQSDPKRDRL